MIPSFLFFTFRKVPECGEELYSILIYLYNSQQWHPPTPRWISAQLSWKIPPKSSGCLGSPPSPTCSLADHHVAPDQFDPKWETNKLEIWSYYAYYIGNNGLTLFNFAPTAFQNLLYQAAGDGTSLFLLREGNEQLTASSLLSNGISFAIQIVVFLFLGSFADFGTWRPNILIALSLFAWGIGFGWLGVHDPSKW